MSSTKKGEILTLQFGHYSNFVGTHWWNAQERSFNYSHVSGVQEINHDILYREGLNEKGQVTYTPRLLLVDLKGSLGSHSTNSQLYEEIAEPSAIKIEWEPTRIEIKTEPKIEKNKFQQNLEKEVSECGTDSNYDLENEVKVWSDFLFTRFHPRTLNIVKEYQHSDDNLFNTFPSGKELWKSEQFEDEFSDKIRHYIEECDYFQGFQILLDATDGFSGLSSACSEYLNDEYRRNIVAFPLIPSFYSDYKYVTDEERHQSIIKDSTRVINLSFCFNSLREFSSLFVPLCTGTNGWRQPGEKRKFYHTNYDHEKYYHSGAILASALDTFSLKYRLKSDNYTLQDLTMDLTPDKRKAAAASLCLPFSFNSDADLIECLDNWTGPLTQTITPNCTLGSDHMIQSFTLRGIPEERLKKSLAKAGSQKDLPAYKCQSVKEMLEFYLSCSTFNSINNVTVVNKPFTTKIPYPNFFDEFVGENGQIMSTSRPSSTNVENVPVMAGLHNGSEIGTMLESLHTETKRIKFGKFHQFRSAGIENDDFVQCLDDLFDFRECYEDNYFL